MIQNKTTYLEYIRHKELLNEYAIVANHNHHCFEISYFLSGEGQVIIGDTVYNFKPHSFIVLPPHVVHSVISDGFEVIYTGFFYDNSLLEINKEFFIEKKDGNDILNVLLLMEKTVSEKNKNYELLLTELQNIFLYNLLEIIHKDKTAESDFLEKASSFIKKNFSSDIDFSELAAKYGYSYHHFRHLFKEKYGVSLKQFHLNEKIRNSMQMLTCTAQDIKQIASFCGFNSTTNFIKNFKNHTNMTPSQYRHHIKENIETSNFLFEKSDN